MTSKTRAAVLQAARDAEAFSRMNPTGDVVDLASETGNYWFCTGPMSDRESRAALRLVGMQMDRGRRSVVR